ncbi:MAG: amidase family protein [Vicinamibacterales bacterium]
MTRDSSEPATYDRGLPPAPDLLTRDARTLARLVAAGEISALELVDLHLARIAEVDGALGAFVDVAADAAREEARRQDEGAARGEARGPLGGVPVTVKSAIEVAGLRCETGSPARAGVTATGDAVVVQRLRAAGAIVLGTTNVAEMLMGYETVNPLHGRTSHPLDLSRTPGGSSGGESAAIAAGCSAAGIGSDGGGSIRVPAHFTGLCGLKPTPGRIPATGHQPPCLGPFALIGVVGPIARTIGDLQLLDSVLAGWDAGDPLGATGQAMPFAAEATAWWCDSHPEAPTTPETRRAIAAAVDGLAAAGWATQARVPAGLDDAVTLWNVVFGDVGELLLAGAYGEGVRGLPIPGALHLERGPRRSLTALELATTLIARDELRASVSRQLGGRLLLSPVSIGPAFRHDERVWVVNGREVGYLEATRYTQWGNLLGLPAAVVPAGRSAEGLPIGVQVAGAPFMDAHVLACAAVIERHIGDWRTRG